MSKETIHVTDQSHEAQTINVNRERLKKFGKNVAVVAGAALALGSAGEAITGGKPVAEGIQRVSAETEWEAYGQVEGAGGAIGKDEMRDAGFAEEVAPGVFDVPESATMERDFNPLNDSPEWDLDQDKE